MPRRRRPNWPLRFVLAGVAMLAFAYVAAGVISASMRGYPPGEAILSRLIDLLVAAWLFWVGAAVGSFLNVVAWRMPRGRSIGGFSRCPYCATTIASRDNIPVLGWLAIRGRCRRCRLPISPRYPIVELAVGLSFAVVGLAEVYSGGANLPQSAGEPRHAMHITWSLVGLGGYHLVALAGLWAMGLIRLDDHAIPGRLMAVVLAAVTLPALLGAPVQVVPWRLGPPHAGGDASQGLDAILYVLCGLAAAGLVGRFLGRILCPGADFKLDPLGRGTRRLLDLLVVLAVVGITCGWQTLLGTALLAAALALAAQYFLPWGMPLGVFVLMIAPAMALHVAGWRYWFQVPGWPAPGHHPLWHIAAFLVTGILAWWLQRSALSRGPGGSPGEPEAPEAAAGSPPIPEDAEAADHD